MVRGSDGVDYDVATVARWRLEPGGDIWITVFVGEANWGGPHDAMDESVLISQQERTAD
jgi:hypothetical protein